MKWKEEEGKVGNPNPETRGKDLYQGHDSVANTQMVREEKVGD